LRGCNFVVTTVRGDRDYTVYLDRDGKAEFALFHGVVTLQE
jgi:hypothetical protein